MKMKRMSEEERFVAETLLLLSAKTSTSKCIIIIPRWGSKRRRSAIDVPVSKAEADAEVSSPASPLSFSALPTESDDKDDDSAPLPPPPIPSLNLNLNKEHYLQIIQNLQKYNHLLASEIKNVNSYFDRLKHFNSMLKARKLELLSNNGPNEKNDGAAPPQIRESADVDEQACDHPTTSFDVGNSVGPIGIPDLNLPAEEDEDCTSWALEAQARQNAVIFTVI